MEAVEPTVNALERNAENGNKAKVLVEEMTDINPSRDWIDMLLALAALMATPLSAPLVPASGALQEVSRFHR